VFSEFRGNYFFVTELKEDAGGKAVVCGRSSVVDTHHRTS
jgi:hypothetical protein